MKPTLAVISASTNKVSAKTGKNACTVVFSCSTALQLFEIRATRQGASRGVGVGDLLYSASDTAAGQNITAVLSSGDITQGDGAYVISLWGKARDGYIDFGNLDFNDINFGDLGEWNT